MPKCSAVHTSFAPPDAVEQPLVTGLKNGHYLVLVGSLILTLVVWNYASSQVKKQAEATFDRAADQVLELTSERMKSYEDGLWAGVGAIYANGGEMGLDEWRVFARTLQIDIKYPGINGIGVIFSVPGAATAEFVARQQVARPDFRIYPEHERGIYLPITFIEPEAPNAKAVGLDMSFEDNRFGGIIAARDSGEARITGPITLVQDEGSTPGFLFFAPFYKGGHPDRTENRNSDFQGAVYAPFVVKKLMRGVLDREKRQVWVSISDGDTIIYDEHTDDEVGNDDNPMFVRHVEMNVYGRTWTIDMRTNAAFRAANARSQPTVILVCGLTIDALLLFLFSSMARANGRAISYADRVTQQLRKEKRDLMVTNAALEQFSYVASHDLKTPIRSMNDVTDYLIDDIKEHHPKTLEDKGISDQFLDLKSLIRRMDALVKGVLECAQINNQDQPAVACNAREAILSAAGDLRLRAPSLTLRGEFPDLLINETILSQIFGNLLCNARNHCGDPDAVRIVVTGRTMPEGVEFRVTDNGPGIDPQYHEKIFQIFQSLNPTKSPTSTGIGLAIVRKAVETAGGSVAVQSKPGQGACFIVTLPETVCVASNDIAAE